MSTKTLLIVSAVFAVGVSLEIPELLSQGRGPRMNANLIEICLSITGFVVCAVLVVIKNATARNSGQ